MPNRIQLEGTQIGEWSVLKYLGDNYYWCKCSCGRYRRVHSYYLRNGVSKSCGHRTPTEEELAAGYVCGDLTGKHIGEWEVLRICEDNNSWLCKCSCGVIKKVQDRPLRRGASKSCGHATTKRIELTGKQFGELTVTGYAGNSRWYCKCSCGKTIDVDTKFLRDGTKTDCGHSRIIDMKGQKIGKLTALEYVGNRCWKCQCECGNIIEVDGRELRKGNVTQCHECSIQSRHIDMTGQKFGELTVVRYLGDGKWECECSCGEKVITTRYRLVNGKKTHCGHLNKPRIENLTGRTFNELTVIEDNLGDKIKCRCSCGVEKWFNRYAVRCGSTKSCGHTKGRPKDILGQTFGKLTVIEDAGHGYWKCRCSCGREVECYGSYLRAGRTTSCGCSMRKDDLTGKRFGRLTVVGPAGTGGLWLCKCDCGKERLTIRNRLEGGRVKSCGCLHDERPAQYTEEEIRAKIIEAYGQEKEKPTFGEVCLLMGYCETTIKNYNFNNGINIDDLINTKFGSKGERKLYEYLLEIGVQSKEISIHTRFSGRTTGHELDLCLRGRGIGFEYNGSIYHCDAYKDDGYHQRKSVDMEELWDISVIHISDYEWEDWNKNGATERIKGLIRNRLGIYDRRIGARETSVEGIDMAEAKQFCMENHLQGWARASVAIGLRDENGELLEIMTFGPARYQAEYQWELIRLCSKIGTAVVGGASKILAEFVRLHDPVSIVSYCDISKFSGEIYTKLGFKYIGMTKPGYCWVNIVERHVLRRYETTRERISKWHEFEPGETEDDVMRDRGYNKVYNSGNKKFLWTKE